MSAFWQSPALVLALLAWLAAPPASLGEAAQREAMRRRLMPKSTAHLTNLGHPAEVQPTPVQTPLPTPVTDVPLAPPPPPAPPVPPAEKRDEQWWRARVAAARTAIERSGVMADALQSRVNALQRDAVNMDDPAQQSKLRADLGKALGELDRTTKQIEADRKALAAVQEEARRADVPAVWVR